MRSTERLRKLKAWAQKELCDGRKMKAPSPTLRLDEITYQEPRCYLGWEPRRPDTTGYEPDAPFSVCPGILIMPAPSKGKDMEEKRFDRYGGVHRPKGLGQTLSVSILFSVYEPGNRLEGFTESAKNENAQGMNLDLLTEGTEDGLFTLYNWMDDCVEKLLGIKQIPHTDLFVHEETIVYSPYTDQSFVVDKRPLFYGFVNVEFGCYANEGTNPAINEYLI